jgi:hypothetical protein
MEMRAIREYAASEVRDMRDLPCYFTGLAFSMPAVNEFAPDVRVIFSFQ